MRGAEGIGEMLGDAFRFVASIMEDELLGNAVFAERFEPGDDFGVGFIPGHAFPFSFAAFADALEWVENALGVIGVGNHPLGLRAEVALGVGIEGIAFDLADDAVLHPADDAAVVGAGKTDGGSGFGLGVIEVAKGSEGESAFWKLGGNLERSESSGEESGTEFENGTTINHEKNRVGNLFFAEVVLLVSDVFVAGIELNAGENFLFHPGLVVDVENAGVGLGLRLPGPGIPLGGEF